MRILLTGSLLILFAFAGRAQEHYLLAQQSFLYLDAEARPARFNEQPAFFRRHVPSFGYRFTGKLGWSHQADVSWRMRNGIGFQSIRQRESTLRYEVMKAIPTGLSEPWRIQVSIGPQFYHLREFTEEPDAVGVQWERTDAGIHLNTFAYLEHHWPSGWVAFCSAALISLDFRGRNEAILDPRSNVDVYYPGIKESTFTAGGTLRLGIAYRMVKART